MNAPTLQPMFSQEAEQSVIGGLLLDPRAWDIIGDLITEADFHTEAHRLIFRSIGLMLARAFRLMSSRLPKPWSRLATASALVASLILAIW